MFLGLDLGSSTSSLATGGGTTPQAISPSTWKEEELLLKLSGEVKARNPNLEVKSRAETGVALFVCLQRFFLLSDGGAPRPKICPKYPLKYRLYFSITSMDCCACAGLGLNFFVFIKLTLESLRKREKKASVKKVLPSILTVDARTP